MGLIVAGWLGRALLHTSLVDRTPLSARQCNRVLHQARANQRGLNMLRESLTQEGTAMHDELAQCGVSIDQRALDDAPPITAVVSRSYHARGVEGVTVRRYCVPLPAESLVRVRAGEGSEQELYVVAPALSYVIEASGDKLAKAVMAGMELCGSYLVIGGKAKKCVYGLHPLTTKDELAQGLAALRQAAALPAEAELSEASTGEAAQGEAARAETDPGEAAHVEAAHVEAAGAEAGQAASRTASTLLRPPSSQLDTAGAALSGVGAPFADASQASDASQSGAPILSADALQTGVPASAPAPSMGSVLSEAGVTPLLQSLPTDTAPEGEAASSASSVSFSASSDTSRDAARSRDDSDSLGIASKLLKPSASQLEPKSAAASSGASVPPASSIESEAGASSVGAAQSGPGALPADTLLTGVFAPSAAQVSPADMISAQSSASFVSSIDGGSSVLLHGNPDTAPEENPEKELLEKNNDERVLGDKSETPAKSPLLSALREPQTEEHGAASSAEPQSGELAGESLVHDALKSRSGVREVLSRAGTHELLSRAEPPFSMREPEEPQPETSEAPSQAPAQNSELLTGAELQNSTPQRDSSQFDVALTSTSQPAAPQSGVSQTDAFQPGTLHTDAAASQPAASQPAAASTAASQPAAAPTRMKARIRGLSVCLDALPHVLERSPSPLETSVAALLTLPAMGGGYGFSGLRLNHRLELSPEAQDIAGSEAITVDGWFAKARTGFEYDGDEFSELPGAKNRGSGSQHVEAAAKDGMTIHMITRELLSDPKQFDELCYELREELGKPHRTVGPRTLHRRDLLRHDLGLAPDQPEAEGSEPEGSEPDAEADRPDPEGSEPDAEADRPEPEGPEQALSPIADEKTHQFDRPHRREVGNKGDC